MNAKILTCECAHLVQDALHGKGRRVHNGLKPGKGSTPSFRCTVCLKVREK